MRVDQGKKSRLPQFLGPIVKSPTVLGNAIQLGRGTVLARIVSNGDSWISQSPDDDTLAMLVTTAYGRWIAAGDGAVRAIKLAAQCLCKGDRLGAADALNAIRFGEASGAGVDRLFKASALIEAGTAPQAVLAKLLPDLAKYSPNQPRIPAGNAGGGRWFTDGSATAPLASHNGSEGSPHFILAADRVPEATPAEREKFTDDHLADAQYWADKLHVPVENILGLSALESGWGKGRFAIQGNNFINLYAPAPYQTGSMPALESTSRLATFASYGDCLKSLAERYGHLIDGISDPAEFAATLQNAKLFGIDPDTGAKVPGFVSGVTQTIRGFRARVARRKA